MMCWFQDDNASTISEEKVQEWITFRWEQDRDEFIPDNTQLICVEVRNTAKADLESVRLITTRTFFCYEVRISRARSGWSLAFEPLERDHIPIWKENAAAAAAAECRGLGGE
jgi:hypothetical protein